MTLPRDSRGLTIVFGACPAAAVIVNAITAMLRRLPQCFLSWVVRPRDRHDLTWNRWRCFDSAHTYPNYALRPRSHGNPHPLTLSLISARLPLSQDLDVERLTSNSTIQPNPNIKFATTMSRRFALSQGSVRPPRVAEHLHL